MQYTQVQFMGYAGPDGAAVLGRRIAPERVIAAARAGVEGYFPSGGGEVHVYSPQGLPA